jgi:hypothetical protein
MSINPLEERSRFPYEDREPPRKSRARPAALENPEVPRTERIDPATQGPVEEPPPTDWEGQEGVGPGRGDSVKRQEKGKPSPETPPDAPLGGGEHGR